MENISPLDGDVLGLSEFDEFISNSVQVVSSIVGDVVLTSSSATSSSVTSLSVAVLEIEVLDLEQAFFS